MDENRRPLKTRSTRWAQVVAERCVGLGLTPNVISVLSVVFAAGAGFSCWWLGQRGGSAWLLLVLAAVGVQLRLLCNMLDGMVAVNTGRQSKVGEVYNELPDRVGDAFILIGAGYAQLGASWVPLLGWAAALLAVLTAYIRALSVAAGAGQDFCGPMAKPHRMAVLTGGLLLAAGLDLAEVAVPVLPWVLGLICAGTLLTAVRRTRRLLRRLEAA